MEVPQKIKIELPYDPAIPFLSIYPKELRAESKRDIFTPVFIAVLVTIAKTWTQPKCPKTNEWISSVIYTYNGMLVLKRKEILQYATTWVNLEHIMLREINQSQKDRYCMILLT